MAKNHERIAERLAKILIRLNDGERLNISNLAEDYKTCERTIKRDMARLETLFINSNDCGPKYYSIDKSRKGYLTRNDINRLVSFASIQDLLPEIERSFFQEKLLESITIKGFQYENITPKQKAFNEISEAILERLSITFNYQKIGSTNTKTYQIDPYRLVNKSGVWYLIGVDNGKQKTFAFSQIEGLSISRHHFELNEAFYNEINQTDSIYYGNQLGKIILKIDAKVSGYFTRRNLFPNQEQAEFSEDGSLFVTCLQVHPQEVVPIVQYWIPFVQIIHPKELQVQMEQVLTQYLRS